MEFLPAVDRADADAFLRDKGRCLGEFRFSFRGKQYATYAKILSRKVFEGIDTDEKYTTYLKDNVIALGMRSEPLKPDDEKKKLKYKNELQDDNPTMTVTGNKEIVPYNSPCLNLKSYSSQSVLYVDGLSVSTPRNIKKVRCAFPFDSDGALTNEEATAELWVNLANNLAKDFGLSNLVLQDAAFLSLGYPKDTSSGGNIYQAKCPYGFPLSVLYLMEKGKFVYDKYGFTEVALCPEDLDGNRYTVAQQDVYKQRANENREELMSVSTSRINAYFVKDTVNKDGVQRNIDNGEGALTLDQLVNIQGLREFFNRCFYNLVEGRGISAENITTEFKKLAAFCIIYSGGHKKVFDAIKDARENLAGVQKAQDQALRDLGQSPSERKREQMLKIHTKLVQEAEHKIDAVFNDVFFRKTAENSESSLGNVYINFLNQLEKHAVPGSEENPTISSFYTKCLKHCTEPPAIAVLGEDGNPKGDADLREYSQIRCNVVAHLIIQYVFNTKKLWLLETYVTKDKVFTENAITKEMNRYDAWVGSPRYFKKSVSYNNLHITSSKIFPCTKSIEDLKSSVDKKYHFLAYWNKTASDPATAFRNSGVACTNYYIVYSNWKTWFLTHH